MAGIREIAIGITTVLASAREPNPLFIDLWNEPPEAGAAIVKAVIDECVDGDIRIVKVTVDTAVWDALPEHIGEYRGVTIATDPRLNARIEFHR